MEVGEYKIVKSIGKLRLKQLMGLKNDKFIYVLFMNNYIELRTKEQYELLLNKLDNKIKIGIDVNKIKKYKEYVMAYSKTIELLEEHSIYLGIDIICRYGLKERTIIEKCSDCIKLWNPSTFEIKLVEGNSQKHRK